jgi:hypothetical protein
MSAVVTVAGQHGQWQVLDCGGALPQGGFGTGAPLTGGQTWVPLGQPNSSAPAVDPAVVAQQAEQRLTLPKPMVRMSPVQAGRQMTGLATWLWVERGSWSPESATAQVPGVSVTAVATPVSTVWDMADGTAPVVCQGPGTPFVTGDDPGAASPDCGHRFARSSAAAPGGVFQMAVSEHWTVRWQGAGRGGVFPDLVTRSVLPVRVVEVQDLVVSGPGR